MDQPLCYSVIFCNKQILAQINRQLSPVLNEWKQFLMKKEEKILKSLGKTGVTEAMILEQFFNEFVNTSGLFQPALSFHESTNWWEAGKYRIRMDVKVSSPDKTFSEEWSFLLDEESCLNLRANTMATMKEMCMGINEYFFVNAEYI
jgi:hypothetical protein